MTADVILNVKADSVKPFLSEPVVTTDQVVVGVIAGGRGARMHM